VADFYIGASGVLITAEMTNRRDIELGSRRRVVLPMPLLGWLRQLGLVQERRLAAQEKTMGNPKLRSSVISEATGLSTDTGRIVG
jgi:hypothetical protein